LHYEGENCGALAPIFDLYNHQWYATVEWATDDGFMIMTAYKEIEEGNELAVNYGYGF